MQRVLQMVGTYLLMWLLFITGAGALEVRNSVDVRVDTSTDFGLPAQWKQVAMVYAGHHYRIGGPPWPPKFLPSRDNPKLWQGVRGTTDWRVARENHHGHLFEPLVKRGITVDVYFHTWPSHRWIEKELVEYFKPTKYTIASRSSHDSVGVDSRVEALKLIVAPETYDAIIMTRFELILFRPLDLFPIQPQKVNVPFTERVARSGSRRNVMMDLIYIFPPKYLDWFVNGSWTVGHGSGASNPSGQKASKGVMEWSEWQDNVNMMSWEYGQSGSGFLSHDLTTVEDGPYYGYREGPDSVRLGQDSPLPKA